MVRIEDIRFEWVEKDVNPSQLIIFVKGIPNLRGSIRGASEKLIQSTIRDILDEAEKEQGR